MPHASSSTAPAFFGVRVVRAAFLLAFFGWGVGFYGPPVFLHSVIERTGWPLTFVSTAITVHFLAGALAMLALPRLHRRFGVASTVVAGSVVATVGTFGWATAAQPWQLVVAACASGVGWVTMGAVAVNAVVSPWYVRNRPAALAKAYNGASVGGLVFSPLWVAAIAWLGAAGAAALIGGIMVLVVALMGRLFFSKTPESLGHK